MRENIQVNLCQKLLFFVSTNPQHDVRLFIELQVQYMKIPSSNLGKTCSVQKLLLTFRTIFVHKMFSPCSAKRRASDKDLPVLCFFKKLNKRENNLKIVLGFQSQNCFRLIWKNVVIPVKTLKNGPANFDFRQLRVILFNLK